MSVHVPTPSKRFAERFRSFATALHSAINPGFDPMKSVSTLDALRIRNQRQLLGNPLRGLTPEILSSQLDAFQAGDLRSASQTWGIMERRNPVLGSVARKRYKSVSRLDWQVLAVDESPEAKAHAEVLKRFWDGIRVTDALERNRKGGVSMLLYQAAHCIGHRFAVHEIVWNPQPGNLSATFTRVPLWFFENRTGELRFLQSDYALEGQSLEPGGWMVTCGDGLMEPTSVLVSQIGLGLGDWLSYSEKFGIPATVWETNAKPGSDEWTQTENAAASFGSDFAGVVPAGTKIHTIEAGGTGAMPQAALVEYLERRIVTLWRGADLGTMSQGAGGVGASLQGDETTILSEDDILSLSEAFQQQVERYVIEWYFGPGVEPLAYFDLIQPEGDNTDRDIKVDEFLIKSGVPVAVSELAERYGREMSGDGEAIAKSAPSTIPGSPLGAVAAQLANQRDAATQIALAMNEAMAPVRERLKAIATITDPSAQRDALLSLRMELPQLLKQVNADPQAARVFERVIGVALVNGLMTDPAGTN